MEILWFHFTSSPALQALLRLKRDRHLSANRREFRRVGEQIGQHLCDKLTVRQDEERWGWSTRAHLT